MTALDMACVELVELVADYIERDLDAPTRRRFEEHLTTCPYCVAYVEQMRATIAITGRLAAADLPVPVADALVQAFTERYPQP